MLPSVVPCHLVQKPAEKPDRINDREGGYLVQQPTELMENTEGEDTSSVEYLYVGVGVIPPDLH